ncbi:MAG: glycosyltransferase family 2 protein [Acidimicrobiia bacterium]
MTANPEVRSVSAMFPCYNDALSIGKMVRDVNDTLAEVVDDYEIIVVNDGSSDNSLDVLRGLENEFPRLRVINHEVNRGYGGALISGFTAATKDWIFYTDGDAQYDATECAPLIKAVTAETDIVQGWKIGRGDEWHRKVIGRVYHHTVKAMFRLHVRDTDCDFRLFRRSLFERAPLTRTSGVICVEMMTKFQRAGARFIEMPVHHYARPHGKSQFFRVPHIAKSGYQLLQLWFGLTVLDRARRKPSH